MYLCYGYYHHWSGAFKKKEQYWVSKSNPTYSTYIRKSDGAVVKKPKVSTSGKMELIKYTKIQNVLDWNYVKKQKEGSYVNKNNINKRFVS